MLSPRAIFAASSGNAKGIAWMFLAGLIFVIVTGSVRHLSATIHPIQLAFLRYAIALIFLAPVFWRGIRSYRNRPHRYGLHIARGLLQAVGVMLWFYAMANIPVAEVTALGFTAPNLRHYRRGAVSGRKALYAAHLGRAVRFRRCHGHFATGVQGH